jgi:hypothetical protein
LDPESHAHRIPFSMKQEDVLPAAVRRSLDRHLDTVDQLEVLLFLYRESARFWGAAGTSNALHITEQSAAYSLEVLARRGFLDVRIASEVVYRFSPATAALSAAVKEIARAYCAQREPVLAFLTSRRRQSLKEFSEAFRFSKDPDHG